MTFKRIEFIDAAEWDRVLDVNLKGAFLFVKYCIPHMAPGSAIVNVSSAHAKATGATVVPYAASKGGLEAFTRGLASPWISARWSSWPKSGRPTAVGSACSTIRRALHWHSTSARRTRHDRVIRASG
jgi:NADP-dependent 3-hydroxy acid dehydrogenase YdfG